MILFLTPPVLLYGAAVLLPIVQSLVLSFFSWDGITSMQFVGLSNYRHMLGGDPVFWRTCVNQVGYLVICLVLQLGGGLVVASLLASLTRGREVIKVLYLLPAVISTVHNATPVSDSIGPVTPPYFPDTRCTRTPSPRSTTGISSRCRPT